MEVEPKRVLHTSPVRLVEVENRFMIRYPMASAPTEIMATAASPLILVLWPVRSRRIAQITVTGSTSSILLLRFSTAATDMAPKATWLRPSPIKENRLSTSVTPSRDEHRAMSTPTIRAYRTNG